jgi:hypothetical protein
MISDYQHFRVAECTGGICLLVSMATVWNRAGGLHLTICLPPSYSLFTSVARATSRNSILQISLTARLPVTTIHGQSARRAQILPAAGNLRSLRKRNSTLRKSSRYDGMHSLIFKHPVQHPIPLRRRHHSLSQTGGSRRTAPSVRTSDSRRSTCDGGDRPFPLRHKLLRDIFHRNNMRIQGVA